MGYSSLRTSAPRMGARVSRAPLPSGTCRAKDRIPAYGGGRVCEAAGCGTVLSIYNPALNCSVHAAAAKAAPASEFLGWLQIKGLDG
jgi:hypothetical protein